VSISSQFILFVRKSLIPGDDLLKKWSHWKT